MRKLFALFLVASLLCSCDDGDIIVTSFDFDDEALTFCQSGTTKVLYKVDDESYESLSFAFVGSNFTGTTSDLQEPTVLELELTNNNEVLYRRYTNTVPSSYFCAPVPPPQPEVIEEFYSTSGTVVLTTNIHSQDDADGIAAEEEDLNGNGDFFDDDSDGDGIPNFVDIDDDGDGVKTSVEISNTTPGEEGYPDTDGDGVSNYLDNDDDGDGVPTINEDADGDQDPITDDENGNGIPNYLDEESSTHYAAFEAPINIVNRRFRTIVKINNLTLSNGSETITEATEFTFGVYDTGNVQYALEPIEAED